MANATGDEQALSIAASILESVFTERPPWELQADTVRLLIDAAQRLCETDANLNLVTIPEDGQLVLFGDLHGQFQNLVAILKRTGNPSPRNILLFNGDFVDRGPFSLETMLVLISLKLRHPLSVFLNRGNHEAKAVTIEHGFRREVRTRLDVQTYDRFIDFFATIPIASVVAGSTSRVFVAHGGIPVIGSRAVALSQIQGVNRRVEPPRDPEDLLTQLLWNDPTKESGSDVGKRGGYGRLFREADAVRFLRSNDFMCLFRSHEEISQGFRQDFANCFTIYSGNHGQATYVTMNSHLQYEPLTCDVEVDWDVQFRWMGFGDDEEDERESRAILHENRRYIGNSSQP